MGQAGSVTLIYYVNPNLVTFLLNGESSKEGDITGLLEAAGGSEEADGVGESKACNHNMFSLWTTKYMVDISGWSDIQ